MNTSQEAIESGLYASDCCTYEILFLENDSYLRCPACDSLCEWELVEHAVLWTELGN
jgi:hypothetical protein